MQFDFQFNFDSDDFVFQDVGKIFLNIGGVDSPDLTICLFCEFTEYFDFAFISFEGDDGY